MRVRAWAVSTIVIVSSCIGVGAASAAFPGDDGRIAFERYANSGVSVMTLGANGNGSTTLVAGQSPAWSADGTKVAYVRGESPSFRPVIYVANADGTGEQRVGPN